MRFHCSLHLHFYGQLLVAVCAFNHKSPLSERQQVCCTHAGKMSGLWRLINSEK